MPKKRHFLFTLILLIVMLAITSACQTNSETAFLKKYGLDQLSIQEVVAQLDSSITEPVELVSSINGEELTLSDGQQTVKLDLPEDSFYLSFAPYINQTHPCGFHSLSSCRGELVNVPIETKVTDSTGQVILQDTLTSMANGFVGIWLPKGIDATIEVRYDGLSASAPIYTHAESETCLTTPLKLQ